MRRQPLYLDFNSTTCFSRGVNWPLEEDEDKEEEEGASNTCVKTVWNWIARPWLYSTSKLTGSEGSVRSVQDDEEEEEEEEEGQEEEEVFGLKYLEMFACIVQER